MTAVEPATHVKVANKSGCTTPASPKIIAVDSTKEFKTGDRDAGQSAAGGSFRRENQRLRKVG